MQFQNALIVIVLTAGMSGGLGYLIGKSQMTKNLKYLCSECLHKIKL